MDVSLPFSPAASQTGSGAPVGVAEPEPYRCKLPGVHERLAEPETQEEYFDGELRLKLPAKPPHARQQIRLAYVLNAHVAEGYWGAVEMLTRTDPGTDFAPDASVYSQEPDPETGERQLEELAFEVCSAQPLSVPADKARRLIARGVRRVFCIAVKSTEMSKSRLKTHFLEWSTKTDGWSPGPDNAKIVDPCFSSPLPVKGLIDDASSDDAVAEALRAKGNRFFKKKSADGEAKEFAIGEAKGRAEGWAVAILSIIEARGLVVSDQARQQIQSCEDLVRLEQWARCSVSIARVEELWE